MCTASRLHSRKQDKNPARDSGSHECGLSWSPNRSGLRSILFPERKLHLCSNNPSTIHSIHSHISISLYTWNFTTFFFFFFKLQIDPNSDCRWLKLLNHNRTQCYQVVYIYIFFCPYMYSCTCTNSVCMSCIYASDLHHRPWVVTVWLLCGLRWNGTVYQKSRAGELVSLLSTNLLKRWYLSTGGQAAQKTNGRPSPFLSHALFIRFPSLSLTHTHAHAHTL